MASSREEALRLWTHLIESLQPRSPLRRGLIGDGNGTVEVAGLAGWSWIRYEQNQNRLSMVISALSGYMEDGTPVLVGKFNPADDYEQVLGVSWGPYAADMTDYVYAFYKVARHGDTHHGTYGSDPAYVDYANLVMGRVRPMDPPSLMVYVESFVYAYGVETRDYDGGPLDLTAEVPAAGHMYVLVYFDLNGSDIGYVTSAAVPLAVSPSMPVLEDVSAIPLAVVRLYTGQTEIVIDNTWQRKLVLGSIGAPDPLRLALVNEGDVVTHNGEILWVI